MLILPALLLSLERRLTTKSFEEPFFELYDEEEDIDLGRLVVHTDEWDNDSPANHETSDEDEDPDSTPKSPKEDE